jgi:hypothetical protein
VSFTEEDRAAGEVDYNFGRQRYMNDELPGVSVFIRDESGDVFPTYSAYARGLDLLVGAYNYLDLVPKGRDEDSLDFTMAWMRTTIATPPPRRRPDLGPRGLRVEVVRDLDRSQFSPRTTWVLLSSDHDPITGTGRSWSSGTSRRRTRARRPAARVTPWSACS